MLLYLLSLWSGEVGRNFALYTYSINVIIYKGKDWSFSEKKDMQVCKHSGNTFFIVRMNYNYTVWNLSKELGPFNLLPSCLKMLYTVEI